MRTAREIAEACIAIVEASPTWHAHKNEGDNLCWCPTCAYVRGNVTEMRGLLNQIIREEKSMELERVYTIVVAGMEAAKQAAMWGTFGKGGAEHCAGTCPEHRLRYKRLVDCDTEHLQAILRTQWQLVGHDYTYLIRSILVDRGEKPVDFDKAACDEFYKKIEAAQKSSKESNEALTAPPPESDPA